MPGGGASTSGPPSAPGAPLESLRLTRFVRGWLATWKPVAGADYFVARRTGTTDVRLPGTEHSYIWADNIDPLDPLTNVRVRPQLYSVEAWRDGRVVRRYGHFQDCPDLVYIAARGSGQNGYAASARGLGNRGARVLATLRAELGRDEVTLPAIAVDYPAVAVALGPGGQVEAGSYSGIYDSSVAAGVSAATLAILRTLISCRRTRLVLFGYSQGAQVIGNAFAALRPSARAQIARVILFADARYAPGDPQVDYRPAAPTRHGIKGAREPFPAGGPAVIESWCWSSDAICQLAPTNLRHFHGPVYDDYEPLAARAAADALN